MKVRELLTDESKWCKYELCHIDKNGHESYCLVGAIEKCYSGNDEFNKVRLVWEKTGITPTSWNDCAFRTFAEVKQLVEELDI